MCASDVSDVSRGAEAPCSPIPPSEFLFEDHKADIDELRYEMLREGTD